MAARAQQCEAAREIEGCSQSVVAYLFGPVAWDGTSHASQRISHAPGIAAVTAAERAASFGVGVAPARCHEPDLGYADERARVADDR